MCSSDLRRPVGPVGEEAPANLARDVGEAGNVCGQRPLIVRAHGLDAVERDLEEDDEDRVDRHQQTVERFFESQFLHQIERQSGRCLKEGECNRKSADQKGEERRILEVLPRL